MNFKNFSILIALLLTVSAYGQSKTITVNSVPATIDDFLSLRNQLAATPEGGAVVMITALQMHARNKSLGLQAMTIALDSSNLEQGNAYKGYQPHRSLNYHFSRMEKIPYAPFAYAKGAVPENGYKVSGPLAYSLKRNKFSGDESTGKVKVFVDVHGFSARPVTLKRNDKGLWKAFELSSLFLNVQAPPSGKSDDL